MGTPSPGWDTVVRETSALARRRRRQRRQRRQRRMLWLLTVATTAVLVVLAVFIKDISRVPTVAQSAALSASARTLDGGTTSGGKRHQVSSRQSRPPAVSYRQVTDTTSGLSYQRLPSPWRQGCPSDLNTPVFNWSAGENAVAGQVSMGGSVIDWHGLACSGQLQQQFAYADPADLEPTAMSLVSALDLAYYGGVQHSRTIEDSSAMQVRGYLAWIVKFEMNYPDGASQGLTWSSELGAVVVVDLGGSQAPAVLYVSVPANLATQNVTTLIDSLRVS